MPIGNMNICENIRDEPRDIFSSFLANIPFSGNLKGW